MERIIKFRGLRVDGGGWVFGSLNTDNKDVYEILNEEGGDYYVIPETVGQFTGLTDKNGVDIYEGDVISHAKESNRAIECTMIGFDIVVFDERYARFNLGEEDNWGMIYKAYKILDNIHENK